MGKTAEAADSLNRALRAPPKSSEMYFQAALFLIKHNQIPRTAALLEDAKRLIPDTANLVVARAIVLYFTIRDTTPYNMAEAQKAIFQAVALAQPPKGAEIRVLA